MQDMLTVGRLMDSLITTQSKRIHHRDIHCYKVMGLSCQSSSRECQRYLFHPLEFLQLCLPCYMTLQSNFDVQS